MVIREGLPTQTRKLNLDPAVVTLAAFSSFLKHVLMSIHVGYVNIHRDDGWIRRTNACSTDYEWSDGSQSLTTGCARSEYIPQPFLWFLMWKSAGAWGCLLTEDVVPMCIGFIG